MKAYLLAAGLGTRLRPLTNTLPKCMVPIREKPLLGWWLDLLLRHGITEVLVNTHYLPDPVRGYIHDYNIKDTGLRATEFYESTLLGSGGTVSCNRDFIDQDEPFLICYADDLTDINLTKMRKYHESHNGILTMALFRTESPRQCGIAQTDDCGRIIEFVEKPNNPKSNLANAGIYIADKRLFDYFPATGFIDFGKDVLPKLTGGMYGWETRDYLIDIGTPENLHRAREEWGI